MNFGLLAAEIDPIVWAPQLILFQRLSRLDSVTAWQSSSERQPNFAAMNRGCHLCSAGRPSCWAFAHILVVTVRQMQQNFRVKGKKLYFGFVDLEKAFDRVPREMIRWAMYKLGVEEWLVYAVMLSGQVQKQLLEQFMVIVVVLR